jgi:hypothetical protein
VLTLDHELVPTELIALTLATTKLFSDRFQGELSKLAIDTVQEAAEITVGLVPSQLECSLNVTPSDCNI